MSAIAVFESVSPSLAVNVTCFDGAGLSSVFAVRDRAQRGLVLGERAGAGQRQHVGRVVVGAERDAVAAVVVDPRQLVAGLLAGRDRDLAALEVRVVDVRDGERAR